MTGRRNEGSFSGNSLLSTYNSTMHLLAENSNVQHSPITCQLDVQWESATPEAKSQCGDKGQGGMSPPYAT
ncbi:hypothetical protein OS493_023384 [Desmophyllum pertusum]|uniref:Uncharacterized protein n=1 Tax=Desmophyllum pertusum TaxID=174260 RepID=A0A9X0D7W2_9CNID|nr:hypothetical protein OS493_023384 [Desmophyllum pertusum]